MFVARVKPVAALRDVVESIWVQDDDDASIPRAPSCVVPTGTIEILFHYGDLLAHVESGRVVPMPRSYVTGQRSRPVFTLTGPRVGIVIVSLYPWGLNSLFRECIETPDAYVDLAHLIGRGRTSRLEERLLAATDPRERIRLVEAFLLGQRRAGVSDLRMVAASGMLASSVAPFPVHEMADRFSMSRRHFSRTFRSKIGIPPKTFSRIMRFQNAMRRRALGRPWAAVAAECGYADQAHLSHEVKRFSTRSACALEQPRDAPDSYFNGAGVSDFFNTVYL